MLTLCLITGLIIHSYAQEPLKVKYGKIDRSVVAMETFEADPEAEAVILYNKGIAKVTTHGGDLIQSYSVHKRIKVLKESAISYADLEFMEYGKSTYMFKIEAASYNLGEGGKVISTALSKKEITREKMGDENKKISFSIPQVKVGSVIELRYTMHTSGYSQLIPWNFQQEIPVLYSEYETQIPNWFTYVKMSKGCNEVDETYSQVYVENAAFVVDNNSQGSERYSLKMNGKSTRYIHREIPAFVSEPYITTVNDHLCGIEFQLASTEIPGSLYENHMTNWQALASELLGSDYIGKAYNQKGKIKEWLAEHNLVKESSTETASAIYYAVQQYFKWDGDYSYSTSNTARDFLINKSGDSGDINLFLLAALKEANIPAYPVLISTRDHGKMQDIYPILRQFNHMIVLVELEGKIAFLDGIGKGLSFGMLPTGDLNHMGFLLAPGQSKWIAVETSMGLNTKYSTHFTLDESGKLNGRIMMICKEYDAFRALKMYKKEEDDDKFLTENVLEDFSSYEMETSEIKLDTARQHFIAKCELQCQDFVNSMGDMIYLQPMLSLALDENPFKLEKRNYPVDFATPIKWEYVMIYQLPEGFQTDEMPEQVNLALPGKEAIFTYNYNILGNTIQLVSKVQVNQSLFEPEKYEGLKDFFQLIVDKYAEQIVLKKQS